MRICNGYTYPTAWSGRAWLSLPPPTRGSSGDKKKKVRDYVPTGKRY